MRTHLAHISITCATLNHCVLATCGVSLCNSSQHQLCLDQTCSGAPAASCSHGDHCQQHNARVYFQPNEIQ